MYPGTKSLPVPALAATSMILVKGFYSWIKSEQVKTNKMVYMYVPSEDSDLPSLIRDFAVYFMGS